MSEIKIGLKVEADVESANQKLKSVGDTAGTVADKIEAGNQRAKTSYGDTAKSLVAVAGTAMALYDAYDRIEGAQLRVDRAALQVKKSQEGVEDAQKKLNEAIAKYGENSQEAKDALEDLAIAQEQLDIKQRQAQQTQQDLNRTYISTATTSIPMLIMALGQLKGAYASVSAIAVAAGGVVTAGLVAGAALVGAMTIPGWLSHLQSTLDQLSKGDVWSSRFSATVGVLANPFAQMLDSLKQYMQLLGLLPKNIGTITDLFDKMREKAGEAFGKILDDAKSKFGDIKKAIEDKWDEITKGIDEKLIQPITKEFDKIKDAFTKAFEPLTQTATQTFNQIVQTIQSALQQATQAIQQFIQQAAQSLQQLMQQISQAAQSASQGFGGGGGGARDGGGGQQSGWGFNQQSNQYGFQSPYGFQPSDLGYYYGSGISELPPWNNYYQHGAVFNKPTLLRNAMVGETETEYLIPQSKLSKATRGGGTFHFTIYINEVVNAKDPTWRRALARDIMTEAYGAVNRGVTL